MLKCLDHFLLMYGFQLLSANLMGCKRQFIADILVSKLLKWREVDTLLFLPLQNSVGGSCDRWANLKDSNVTGESNWWEEKKCMSYECKCDVVDFPWILRQCFIDLGSMLHRLVPLPLAYPCWHDTTRIQGRDTGMTRLQWLEVM